MLEITKEKEPEEYFMVTLDFSSAQNRQAAQDQSLGDDGSIKASNIDKVMFELYGDPRVDPIYGSLGGDMHTKTLYDFFVSPSKEKVLEVIDDTTGKEYLIGLDMYMYVDRSDGQKNVLVKGRDLKPDDIIIGYEDKRNK